MDGFQVARPLAVRARTAASARGTLATAGPTVKALAGKASAASGVSPALRCSRPLLGRSQGSTGAKAALAVFTAAPPPGVFATFRQLVAGVLDGATVPVTSVFAMLRSSVAGALTLDDEWEVHPLPVDSLTPPAFMLEWADTWHNPATHCFTAAHLDVICIAGRIEPDPGIETLELMVEAALLAFRNAGITCGEGTGPRPFEIGGVTYLACRIPVHSNVNVGA